MFIVLTVLVEAVSFLSQIDLSQLVGIGWFPRRGIFDVATLVSYISEFMTLMPGDVITTGTPPGVGMGIKPQPQYLKAGDVVRLGIEKLGEQQQTFVAWGENR